MCWLIWENTVSNKTKSTFVHSSLRWKDQLLKESGLCFFINLLWVLSPTQHIVIVLRIFFKRLRVWLLCFHVGFFFQLINGSHLSAARLCFTIKTWEAFKYFYSTESNTAEIHIYCVFEYLTSHRMQLYFLLKWQEYGVNLM